jgi:methyl-accepting chemotaxis protein
MNRYRIEHNIKSSKFLTIVFALHIPLCFLLNYIYKAELAITLPATILITLTSYIAYKTCIQSKLLYVVFGANAMLTSAVVIYAGRGLPEFHFHYFVMMSLLIVMSHWIPIISAVLVITAHHIITYFFLPGVGFPIEYPFGLYALHFIAAVFQAGPCLLIVIKNMSIVDNQGDLLTDLKEVMDDNNNASTKLKNSTEQVDSNTFNQMSSLDQTTAAIVQIESMMNKNQSAIKDSNEDTKNAFELLTNTKDKINILRSKMESLSTENHSVTDELKQATTDLDEMVSLMGQVATKSEVINDIVFQTKLLSFNASVEAARAGEAGKGFAVVAEEIGILAETSGKASVEIATLVQTSQDQIQSVADKMKKKIDYLGDVSTKGITEGLNLAEDSGSDIGNTFRFFEKIKSTSDSIDQASREQLIGVNNISEAIQNIKESLDSSSNVIKETKTISDQMNTRSSHLLQLLNRFDDSKRSSTSKTNTEENVDFEDIS